MSNVSTCPSLDLLHNHRQKIRATARVWEDKPLAPSLCVFLIHPYVKTFQRTLKNTVCSCVREHLVNVAFLSCKRITNAILLALSPMDYKLDLSQQQCLSINPSCQPAWLPVSRIWALTYMNISWLKLTTLVHHRNFKDTMVRQPHFKGTFEPKNLETDFFTTHLTHRTGYTVPGDAAKSAMCRSSSESKTNQFHTHTQFREKEYGQRWVVDVIGRFGRPVDMRFGQRPLVACSVVALELQTCRSIVKNCPRGKCSNPQCAGRTDRRTSIEIVAMLCALSCDHTSISFHSCSSSLLTSARPSRAIPLWHVDPLCRPTKR